MFSGRFTVLMVCLSHTTCSSIFQCTTLIHATGGFSGPNNTERAVFVFSRQSDHHVLRQIKGGPSGQKAMKMTCCERMQSGMSHNFYWHLFGCCALRCWKKKVNVWMKVLSWNVFSLLLVFSNPRWVFVYCCFTTYFQHHISGSSNQDMHLFWNCEVIKCI